MRSALEDALAVPPPRGRRRARWLLGGAAALLVGWYAVHVYRVSLGDLRDADLATLWRPVAPADSIYAATGLAASAAAAPEAAPVLERIAQAWVAEQNAALPNAIVRVWPLEGGSLAVALHPALVAEVGRAQVDAYVVERLTPHWLHTLATTAGPWPGGITQRDAAGAPVLCAPGRPALGVRVIAPGLLVVERVDTGATPGLKVRYDTRDGCAVRADD